MQPKKQHRYFFLTRRPSLRAVPREWVRPDDYESRLEREGFLSKAMATSNELAFDYEQLEQHLMPHFWRMDQIARFYQNRYYLYQWIFILSAFFTTTLAAVTMLIYNTDANAHVLGIHATDVLAIGTTIISGVATAVAFLGANTSPQKRWFKARAQAESLRSLYFLYLAHQPPFDIPDSKKRLEEMRVKTLDVFKQSKGPEVRS
jgi:hypothetical protein